MPWQPLQIYTMPWVAPNSWTPHHLFGRWGSKLVIPRSFHLRDLTCFQCREEVTVCSSRPWSQAFQKKTVIDSLPASWPGLAPPLTTFYNCHKRWMPRLTCQTEPNTSTIGFWNPFGPTESTNVSIYCIILPSWFGTVFKTPTSMS